MNDEMVKRMAETTAGAVADLHERIAALEKERDDARRAGNRLAGDVMAWEAKARAAESERDAALADNVALLKLIADIVGCIHATHVDMGGQHKYSVRNGPAAVKAIGAALALSPTDHPGAALLEEHRNALVRARNYSLDRVYERLGHCLADHPEAIELLASLMNEVRAMKEPE